MMTFIAIVHILVALVLIGLVLIQDSKGGGALGIGGGGSNSLLGATGAQTLAARMTRWMAVVFALTCITLTVMTAGKTKSVIDSLPAAAPAPMEPAAAPTPATDTTPEDKGSEVPPKADQSATPKADAAAPAAPPAGK